MGMEGMRDLLKRSLVKSLREMPDEDKIVVAWPVACGKAMAERGTVVGYSKGVVLVEVADAAWLRQMLSIQGQLAWEIGRISGVRVRGIDFKTRDSL